MGLFRSVLHVSLTGLATIAATGIFSCGDPTCEERATCASSTNDPDAGDGGIQDSAIGPNGDGSPDAFVSAFDLTATAPTLVTVGDSIELNLSVKRSGAGSVTGDVSVALDPQSGLTSDPSVVIAGGATTGKLKVSVQADRKHGKLDLALTATATPSGLKAAGHALTSVRGLPGTLDTSFGADGTFTFDKADSDGTGVVVESDGKIVLGGRAGTSVAVVRLLDDGTVDPSFNNGVTTFPTANAVITSRDLVRDKANGLALLFSSTVASSEPGFILRLKADGTIDTAFGVSSNGVLKLTLDNPTSLIIGPDDALYAAGKGSSLGQYVLKLKPNGTPDPQWPGGLSAENATGANCAGLSSTTCYTQTLAIEADGSIVACRPRGDTLQVDRISTTGTRTTILTSTTDTLFTKCKSLLPDPAAATFVYLGSFTQATNGFVLFRFAGDASLTKYKSPDEVGFIGARRLATASDGKLIIGVEALLNSMPALGVARMTSLNVVDTTFNKTGYAAVQVGGKPSTLKAMAIDSMGRIIVAGTNGNMVAARFWN